MKPAMKRAWRLLGAALLAASFAYLALFAVRHAAQLPAIPWTAETVAALAAALGLYESILLSSAAAWYLLLRSTGERPAFLPVLTIFLLSQAAKYLPGNVGHYVGRVALARERGLGTGSVLVTLAVETACSVLAATALAAAAFPAAFSGSALLTGAPPAARLAAVALGLGVALALAAWLLGQPAFRAWVRLPARAGRARRPASTWLSCLALSGLNFLLFGACADVLARHLFAPAASSFAALAGLFAAAWVAGFVTPGAPAGLGVREAVLVGSLQPLYGPGVALGLPLFFRLVTTLGDGLAFGAGLLLRRRLPRPADSAAESAGA